MEEAATCRQAATDALQDIDPEELRAKLESVLDETSLAPGALTLVSARSAGTDPDLVADHAAGVQLIYTGLGLIRRLARDDPWREAVTVDGDRVDVEGDLTDSDMAVLAADVLVSRGFYLLANTAAAGKAVETVRAFGRDQTLARSSEDPAELDANLETNCLELAVVAGTADADRSPDLLEAARRIGRESGAPLGPVEEVLQGPDPGETADPLIEAVDADVDSAARTSATDH